MASKKWLKLLPGPLAEWEHVWVGSICENTLNTFVYIRDLIELALSTVRPSPRLLNMANSNEQFLTYTFVLARLNCYSSTVLNLCPWTKIKGKSDSVILISMSGVYTRPSGPVRARLSWEYLERPRFESCGWLGTQLLLKPHLLLSIISHPWLDWTCSFHWSTISSTLEYG